MAYGVPHEPTKEKRNLRNTERTPVGATNRASSRLVASSVSAWRGVAGDGGRSNIAHVVQKEEVGWWRCCSFRRHGCKLTSEDPLQLAGYKWLGHSRTVKRKGGRFFGGLGVWMLDSIASSVRSRGGVGNYGGSEGVQWVTYE
jgi:hypothetical protein